MAVCFHRKFWLTKIDKVKTKQHFNWKYAYNVYRQNSDPSSRSASFPIGRPLESRSRKQMDDPRLFFSPLPSQWHARANESSGTLSFQQVTGEVLNRVMTFSYRESRESRRLIARANYWMPERRPAGRPADCANGTRLSFGKHFGALGANRRDRERRRA